MILPKKAVVSLIAPPEQGIHSAIMRNARKLWLAEFTPESAARTLLQWRDEHAFRRPVSDSEILDAINTAYRTPFNKLLIKASRGVSRPPQWPAPNPDKRSRLIDPQFCQYDLWELSPWQRGNTSALKTQFVLERLFPGDPLVCMGWDVEVFDTLPLSEWRHPERMQLVVPSPMSARKGQLKDGSGESAHTLANTGPRRFLVVDFDDQAARDIHAAAAWYLGTLLPLALVMWTGGKGLHAWFFVAGKSDPELRAFFCLACELGADPRLWTRSQFARVPDGSRDDGGRGTTQHVIYFNPEVCG
jgi:hypothetical protein